MFDVEVINVLEEVELFTSTIQYSTKQYYPLYSIIMISRKSKVERYYYTSNKRFEQSLDIYRPPSTDNKTDDNKKDTVVALVVGSAWLGHRSFVYSPTSWWNSSGPRSISKLGYTCVCIRHRGSFMKTFSILTLLFITIMCLLMMTLNNSISSGLCINMLASIFGNSITKRLSKWDRFIVDNIGQGETFVLLFIAGLQLIRFGGDGCATFNDMQKDVLQALAWLKSNEDKIGLKCSSSTKSGEQQVGDNKNTTSNKHQSRFIFGGYSSGGHVASVVCQTPTLWKEHNLPPPHIHCDSLLFISPVLSTKSYHDILSKKVSSLSSASSASLPSLSPSDTGSTSASEHNLSRQSSLATDVSSTLASSKSPTWLTDQVVKGVFGSASSRVPSPIHTYEKSPSIPHVFVGCRNEMFGINLLDTFFASPHYNELLNSMDIESRYTAIDSDHWNILNSKVLSDCLRIELERT